MRTEPDFLRAFFRRNGGPKLSNFRSKRCTEGSKLMIQSQGAPTPPWCITPHPKYPTPKRTCLFWATRVKSKGVPGAAPIAGAMLADTCAERLRLYIDIAIYTLIHIHVHICFTLNERERERERESERARDTERGRDRESETERAREGERDRDQRWSRFTVWCEPCSPTPFPGIGSVFTV